MRTSKSNNELVAEASNNQQSGITYHLTACVQHTCISTWLTYHRDSQFTSEAQNTPQNTSEPHICLKVSAKHLPSFL